MYFSVYSVVCDGIVSFMRCNRNVQSSCTQMFAYRFAEMPDQFLIGVEVAEARYTRSSRLTTHNTDPSFHVELHSLSTYSHKSWQITSALFVVGGCNYYKRCLVIFVVHGGVLARGGSRSQPSFHILQVVNSMQLFGSVFTKHCHVRTVESGFSQLNPYKGEY